MKRFILLAMVLFGSITLYAQDVEKSTHHYATHQGQELLLDRYMVQGEDNEVRPCMIFAFGGGFVRGSRDVDFYMGYFERLAREGIVVVSIDYRLGLSNLQSDGGIVAMIGAFDNAVTIAVEDIYCATNFVCANAEEWGVDTEMIMLSGSSAGAIASVQAEWMRANGDWHADVLPEGFRYAGVVSCAGAIFSVDGKPKFETQPAPMLLFHGTSDSNVPYDHASMFGVGFYGSAYIVRQLDKMDAPYWFYSAEYVDHSLAGTPLIDQCDLIMQFINEFVIAGKQLRIRTDVEALDGVKRKTRFKVMDYIRTNYVR